MIDYERIKAGVLVRLSDGTEGEVRGSYLAGDGIVFRVQTNPGSIVQRNVPISQIVEIIEKG